MIDTVLLIWVELSLILSEYTHLYIHIHKYGIEVKIIPLLQLPNTVNVVA